jgi:hypothetical protein
MSKWIQPLSAWLVVASLIAAVACQRTPQTPAARTRPATDPGAQRIEADVRLLSDDAMQGRETGTPGFERAADVVVAHLRTLGLQPAGDNGGYSQRVPLLKATHVADGARLDVLRADRTIHLRLHDHFLTEPNFDAADASVRAQAVFVGQAISAPDLGHDDFAGLDVSGRIAVVIGGAPARFDDDRRAVEASTAEKLRALAAHGAIGAVFIDTAEDEMQLPWSQRNTRWERPALALRDSAGNAIDTLPQLKVVVRVSAAAADLLLDGSGHTAAELAAAARDDRLHGFALPITLAMAARTQISPMDSRNVLAVLPGRDPALAAQQLVFSAHLDHLGMLPASQPATDRIFNGALDNALGVAIVLETARQLHAQPQPPRRSVLFALLTGEEEGLLGAQWLARHPPGQLVADINLDMPMLLAPTRDLVPIGGSHSSLQHAVTAAARDAGLLLSPDPFPEESVFVRSDQYVFVRAGVPSLYLEGGVMPAASSAGKAANEHTMPKLAERDFLRRCYHQTCDDINLPIQYGDGARLARFNVQLAQQLGNQPGAPQWTAGDFFGTRFARPVASQGIHRER